MAVAGAALCAVPASASAAAYPGGMGEVPFYAFEAEQLTDRMELKVNVASGNLLVKNTDLQIAGTGLPLEFERTYTNPE